MLNMGFITGKSSPKRAGLPLALRLLPAFMDTIRARPDDAIQQLNEPDGAA